MLGNDIVDLKDAGVPSTGFCRRVFSDRELRRLEPALVWEWFAAKEATFKAIKKIRPDSPVPFREIEIDGSEARFEQWKASLAWERSADYVHCVAQLACLPNLRTQVKRAPGEARELALGLLGGGFEIRKDPGPERYRAPRVYQDGRLLPQAEISLSHDGSFVAVALSI